MTLDLQAAAPPLEIDARGVARVRGTRIALEFLVDAFSNGSSAEEIVLRYPTIDLPDAYAVLAYVLRDPDGIEAYMAQRAEREADAGRGLPTGMTVLRERLLARAGGGA